MTLHPKKTHFYLKHLLRSLTEGLKDPRLVIWTKQGGGTHSVKGATHRFAVKPNGTLKDKQARCEDCASQVFWQTGSLGVVKDTGSGL